MANTTKDKKQPSSAKRKSSAKKPSSNFPNFLGMPSKGGKGPGNKRPNRLGLLYLLVLGGIAAFMFWSVQGTDFMGTQQSQPQVASQTQQTQASAGVEQGQAKDTLSTSAFMQAVNEGRVKSASWKVDSGDITGTYWRSGANTSDTTQLVTYASTYAGADNLDTLMAAHPEVNFTVDTANDGLGLNLLVTFLPTLLLILAMVFLMNKAAGQNASAMQFGRVKKQAGQGKRPNVTFKDVAGIDEAVEEIGEIKDFLQKPARFKQMGAKIPRGVLLAGPPGTGKTLLAKAVAGEAKVPFYSISGSDFVEMFVGVGASRVRDLFKQAKANAPAIIFIDEIDAVGRQRGAGLGGGHDEREQTLNQLLVEMDGFDANTNVILIAATNRPDVLDPALLRPGRFDRQITVDRPDVGGREAILKVHAKNKPLAKDIEFSAIAKLTPGFTGADLANLMNEAALLSARHNKKEISMREIEEAMERVIAGPERKSRVVSPVERAIIAYHESGHALVGHYLENSDPVHKITIIPRGQALGYTLSLPEEDHFLESRQKLLDQIATLLGGRVAEELYCTDITTGASNDLERATKLARQMVTRFGMSDALGAQVFGEEQHAVFLGRDFADKQDYSPQTADKIDAEVARIMEEAFLRAQEILKLHTAQIKTMATVLLDRETVEGEAMQALLNDTWDEYLKTHPEKAPKKDAPEHEDAPEQKA